MKTLAAPTVFWNSFSNPFWIIISPCRIASNQKTVNQRLKIWPVFIFALLADSFIFYWSFQILLIYNFEPPGILDRTFHWPIEYETVVVGEWPMKRFNAGRSKIWTRSKITKETPKWCRYRVHGARYTVKIIGMPVITLRHAPWAQSLTTWFANRIVLLLTEYL